MTRKEHVEWAKRRAMEYLHAGEPTMAVTSMLSDLGKHPETKDIVAAMGMIALQAAAASNATKVRQFIEGFQ